MAYPDPPNFTSSDAASAWWTQPDGTRNADAGTAVISQIQFALQAWMASRGLSHEFPDLQGSGMNGSIVLPDAPNPSASARRFEIDGVMGLNTLEMLIHHAAAHGRAYEAASMLQTLQTRNGTMIVPVEYGLEVLAGGPGATVVVDPRAILPPVPPRAAPRAPMPFIAPPITATDTGVFVPGAVQEDWSYQPGPATEDVNFTPSQPLPPAPTPVDGAPATPPPDVTPAPPDTSPPQTTTLVPQSRPRSYVKPALIVTGAALGFWGAVLVVRRLRAA